MIEETARIVAVEPDQVWIESIRKSACDTCSAQKGCGQRALASLGCHHHVAIPTTLPLKVDDYVVIGVPERLIVTGTLWVYCVPLLLMIVATLIADTVADRVIVDTAFDHEMVTILSAFFGLAVGFGAVYTRFFLRRSQANIQPVIVKRLDHNAANDVAVQAVEIQSCPVNPTSKN